MPGEGNVASGQHFAQFTVVLRPAMLGPTLELSVIATQQLGGKLVFLGFLSHYSERERHLQTYLGMQARGADFPQKKRVEPPRRRQKRGCSRCVCSCGYLNWEFFWEGHLFVGPLWGSPLSGSHVRPMGFPWASNGLSLWFPMCLVWASLGLPMGVP